MAVTAAKNRQGAEIAQILPGGIADHLRLAPGDRIVEIDGRAVADILDYQYRTFPAELKLRIVKPDGQEWQAEVEKDEGEPLGLLLTREIFSPVTECANHCRFCFINQLPPGMREALYVKDDDLRLSVLHGNFVTLTNLTDEDWLRLREQRLSPLHVSIHTTDDALRRRLLGNPRAPMILPQLQTLLELGIEIHGQIVACPGVNDGEALEKTLADLAALQPPLASVAVVPVGVTRYARHGLRPYGRIEAERALRHIERWAGAFARGSGSLYAADEWYLLAGRPLPRYSDYGDFPQIANGVGMARDFIRGFRLATRKLPARIGPPRRVILATGMLFLPLLEDLCRRFSAVAGLSVVVAGCPNELFGPDVTVAGLLGGRDVAAGVRPLLAPGTDLVVIPAEMLRDAGDLTLDDMAVEQLAADLGVEVATAAGPSHLLRLVLGRKAAGRRPSRP